MLSATGKADVCRCCSALRAVPSRRSRQVAVHSDLTVLGQSPTSPAAWRHIIKTLKAANVATIRGQEVAFCREKGMGLIDVRTAAQYEQGFIDGFVNVPLYQPIDGWQPYKIGRRLGYAMFGIMNGTEPNPNFLEGVAEHVEPEQGVVLCCNLGASLETEAGKQGVQSRSVIAAYELLQASYANIKVLQEGVNGWRESGRDLWVLEPSATGTEAALE